MSLVISLFCCFLLVNGNAVGKNYDEVDGKAYLKKINADIQVRTTESVLASWAYESNITDENLKHQLDVSAKLANYTKEIWKETIKYPWKTFQDPDVRRQFQKFSVLGTAVLSPAKYEKFNKIISDMQSVYGKAKICNYKNRSDCSLQLEPELTEIFVKSRDPDELRYYWEEWRNAAGKPVRQMYKEYVELSNEAAVLNNFTNNAEFWLKDYEAKDFKQQVEELWQQLRPLYLQLHAFVRRRLREQYGEQHVTKTGPIPAHLLGNMWGQTWSNIFDFTMPYPGKPSMDVTPNMVEQGYTPLRMFKLAEEFFTSLNLSPMPDTFWRNSILEKPKDGRDLICHASAWDFYDGKDFRIKQCTRITMEDLNTVHHEMGHIQYFLQYKNQPLVYKEGTNPGFHEAVGDVMALSVSTPKHLRKIGLLNATEDDAESDINQLYSMALDKIAFLPFGYLMDQWRWSVFEGQTTEKDYNCRWWQLREKYQGLSPSTVRTEDDFDPGAKYHTVGNVPYIRYFVSFVIQFQFHRSLCIAAKEFDPENPASKPLHKCDIYQSKEAGELLKKMLQMGSSKPWPDAMEVMTGQGKMDASALLEYFATLQDWLEQENARTGEFIGWESTQRECIMEEGEGGTNSANNNQGNFDNIAYSYAEFVRQDDSAFAYPEYLEETQPSYQALRHTSKETDYRTNSLFSKRNSRRYSSNPYQPEGSYLQKRRKYFRRSALENSHKRSVKDRTSVLDVSHKMLSPVEKRRREKELRLVSAILKNIEQINTQNPMRHPLPILKNVSWSFNKDSFDGSLPNRRIGGKARLANAKQEKKARLKDSLKEDQRAEDERDIANMLLRAYKGKASKTRLPTDTLGTTEASTKSRDSFKSPTDLLWRAQMIKDEAEKMLRNFNISYITNTSQTDRDGNARSILAKMKESHKILRNILPLYHTPEFFRTGKNSYDHLLRSPGMRSIKDGGQHRRRLEFKEHNLMSFLPATPFKGGDKKRHVQLHSDSKSGRVMLMGNLSEKRFPKRHRKSYKEYHFKPKKPFMYNSVIITPDSRNDKPDDSKDRFVLTMKRNSPTATVRKRAAYRKKSRNAQNIFKNSFSSSVEDNKLNKKNIFQYFGCFQLPF